MDLSAGPSAVEVTVRGRVQGVGFRPFVHRLASGLGLPGDVRNHDGAVVIRLAAEHGPLAEFLDLLRDQAPRHARIDEIALAPRTERPGPGFTVLASTSADGNLPEPPADLATCPACLRELFDPADRRHRYPFLSCTDCGPRASIVFGLPYDRSATVMREFAMCERCAAEYDDPADRRFHAEPIACPDCGPQLSWSGRGGAAPSACAERALAAAVAAVAAGGVVAVKGLGGYQLVCDATDESAVVRLRAVKARARKPLAVMVPDLAAAGRLAECSAQAREALTSAAAPIVLLPRLLGSALAPSVAPDLAEIGLFLPYTPLHHLLLAALARPLVVTSGNPGGVPVITEDEEALRVLGPVCDGVLGHNRRIHARHDDSVVRPARGGIAVLRRARGYAPAALPLPHPPRVPVLALGAQLKHTVALAAGERVILAPHTGDLSTAEGLAAFEHGVDLLCRRQRVAPCVYAHDGHPDYLSTQYARRRPATARIAVHHHHAHVVATAAEHSVQEPFVGLAFDGLGLGEGGELWGGEVLLATYRDHRRVGRFGTAPLPGGEAAVRRPARMALGYLFGAEDSGAGGLDPAAAGALLARLPADEVGTVRAMVANDVGCPRASSAGRLFDAVAAFLGLCLDNDYEGEAAVLLEAAATGQPELAPYPVRLTTVDGLSVYDPVPALRALLASAETVAERAARFHATVADAACALARRACAQAEVDRVCLGGGVFQNRRLTESLLERLAAAGLRAWTAARVPVGDGGISYGQAVVASARLRRG
ncbi:hydrogenase maturation protein HypF [Crossiella equi]|uniref:Carbamoyltransferase n=1 Tax=Crossiella equi TaxID=130796 RepID=A0ABS5A643_9PSEU|nr:carbamoyltransferase HypF [Crossiella equi]MBP2472068.1 hydrogenase maturation protein HypF [Crossiella equi]